MYTLNFPIIYPVACHTDNIGAGSTFVAVKGMQHDGIMHILLALQKGATKIVVAHSAHLDPAIEQAIDAAHATLLRVENPRKALAELSAQALQYPAKKLKIVGITGTKGKTTSSFLLEHCLRNAGYTTALLTTVKNKILDYELPTQLTTQHPDYLHVFFDQCVKSGVEYVVMEVAAQALSLHRVDGIAFDGVIFTNFSQEHGEFYPTMQDYFAAKCMIFNHLKNGAPACINADDVWLQKIRDQHHEYITISIRNEADYRAAIVRNQADGLALAVQHQKKDSEIHSPLIGLFNASNILGIFALCIELGLDSQAIISAIATFAFVPGRLELHQLSNGARCFIDYAHTPSSFESVLSTLRPLTDNLIVVFGCGGDRDAAKRPIMGALAAHYADRVIITTDNPRSEEPLAIEGAIIAGISQDVRHKIAAIADRKIAIEHACHIAQPTSIIALLGKGPDHYQLIKGEKFYFNEAEIILRRRMPSS